MYLCIDLGTTSFKSAVFDNNITLLGTASYFLKFLSADIKSEISAIEVMNAFKKIISEALSSACITPEKITGIGITSQAQTFAIVRENSFRTPFITWLDKRAVETCDKISMDLIFKDFSEHASFEKLYPNSQLCIVKHISKSIYDDSEILPLPSYLIKLLSGKNITDNNIAAMSGFYSIPERKWRKKLLEYCGLSEKQMPRIFNVGENVALTSRESSENFGLPGGIPVFSCGNDQTAGAYGADLHNGNKLLITLGTAQVAYTCSDKIPAPSEGCFTGPYPNGKYYKAAVDSYGGAMINMAMNAMPELKDFPTFFDFAEKGRKNGVKVPVMLDEKTNRILWLGNISPEECAYSVLDLITERMGALVGKLNCCKNEILCAGGGRVNKAWIDLLVHKLNQKIKVINSDPLSGIAQIISDK